MCLVIFAGKMFGPKEQFATYRDEISVISSQFTHRMSGSNLLIAIVGTVTNRSGIAWKDVGVEAQFFDKSGKLIDVISVNGDYSHGAVSLLPHDRAGFKVEGRDDYAPL